MLRIRRRLLVMAMVMSPFGPAIAISPPGELGQPTILPSPNALSAAVDRIRSIALTRGERVEGWDIGGADPLADVRRLGAVSHYMLDRSERSASISMLTDRPMASFVPTGWRVADSFGSPANAGEGSVIEFVRLSARYVVGARLDYQRLSDADCYRGVAHALLFENPDAPIAPSDSNVHFRFQVTNISLDGPQICIRYDGNREQGYRARYFLPDGHFLPELSSSNSLRTIIPAGPIDQLLSYR